MTKLDHNHIMRVELAGEMTRKQMAEHFGTSEQYLSKIIARKRREDQIEIDRLAPYKIGASQYGQMYRDGQITLDRLFESSAFVKLAYAGQLKIAMDIAFGSDWANTIDKIESKYRPVEQAEW